MYPLAEHKQQCQRSLCLHLESKLLLWCFYKVSLWLWYFLVKTIADVHFADDRALLANTPTQAESLMHSLEQASGGIDLHVNADKTEYMCFNNKKRDLSKVKRSSLKLVDNSTYLESSVSSTENDIYMRLAKACTAINTLSIIWKSDSFYKTKRYIFKAAIVLNLIYGCTIWTLTEHTETKLYRIWTNPWSNIFQNRSCTATYLPSLKPSK